MGRALEGVFMRKTLLAACTLATLTTTPAAAMSHKSWGHVSDAGVATLGVLAVGGPILGGDTEGLYQAGASLAVGGGVAYGLKQLVHEDRPDGSGNDSFPSAHTSVSFAAAATMHNRYGWQVGVPATLVATLVGVARVKADKHHWYDVVAGAGIGELSGFLLTTKYDNQVQIVPWADSHGAGFSAQAHF